jgi:hypothetical protein
LASSAGEVLTTLLTNAVTSLPDTGLTEYWRFLVSARNAGSCSVGLSLFAAEFAVQRRFPHLLY